MQGLAAEVGVGGACGHVGGVGEKGLQAEVEAVGRLKVRGVAGVGGQQLEAAFLAVDQAWVRFPVEMHHVGNRVMSWDLLSVVVVYSLTYWGTGVTRHSCAVRLLL